MSTLSRFALGTCLTVALAGAPVAYAWAQTANERPDVEIDISILDQLNPTPGGSGQDYRVIPQARQRPSLTAPDRVQSFPITTRTRSDSANPSGSPTEEVVQQRAAPVIESPPAPQKAEAPKKKAKTAVAAKNKPPVPGRKPARQDVAAAKPASSITPSKPAVSPVKVEAAAIVATATENAPPLPKKRPDIQQASSSFVKQAQQELVKEEKAEIAAALAPPPAAATPKMIKTKATDFLKGRHAGPKMPAVPPVDVSVEALALPPPAMGRAAPATAVPLTQGALVSNKQDIVNAIEAIANKKAPTPAASQIALAEKEVITPAGKLVSRDERQPLDKKNNVASHQVPRGPNGAVVEEPERTIITPDEGEAQAQAQAPTADIAGPLKLSLERAEGLERVVVPYLPEAAALDQTMKTALLTEILPLLKRNPNWTVQIQAFAAPQKAGATAGVEKRLSLSRALDMRDWLLSQGIEAARLDVRALGSLGSGYRTPADRVDLALLD